MRRDPLIKFCMAHGLALDRETYIALTYPQGKPDPWTAEHEAELPVIFREPRKWALTESSDLVGLSTSPWDLEASSSAGQRRLGKDR